MGGLATHPAWDAILKLEEWFGNKNLDVHTRRDGSAVAAVKPIGATARTAGRYSADAGRTL